LPQTVSERIISNEKKKLWIMPMRRLVYLLLILCFSISVIGIVHANSGSFNLAPGNQTVCEIPVSSGDRVQLTFTAVGDDSNSLLFWIVFPNSTVTNLGNVDQFSASFRSSVGGTYELYFNNTSSSETILVALNYEVDHYILGIPEMIFVLAVIVVLLMTFVSAYIIMSKYKT
jgi:hypothetical protein